MRGSLILHGNEKMTIQVFKAKLGGAGCSNGSERERRANE